MSQLSSWADLENSIKGPDNFFLVTSIFYKGPYKPILVQLLFEVGGLYQFFGNI